MKDGAGCALFFVCAYVEETRVVPLCLSFLILSAISLVGSGAMVSFLLASRSNRLDPMGQVGLVDLVLAGVLVYAASAMLNRTLSSESRDVLFHFAYASFLATCGFAFFSARLVYVRLGGGGTVVSSAQRDEDEDEEKVVTREPSSDNVLETRITEDGPLVTLGSGPSLKTLAIGIASTYVGAATVSGVSHAFESSDFVGLAVVTPGLIVACLSVCSLVMYVLVLRRAGISYPQERARAVKRAIVFFAVAHAAKITFVVMATIVASTERLFFGKCRRDSRGWTDWPSPRILMDMSLASIGLLDAVAFFSNSPWYVTERTRRSQTSDGEDEDETSSTQFSNKAAGVLDDRQSFAPWAQSIAPLHLIRIDEERLANARSIGRGTFGTVKKLSSRSVSSGKRLQEAGIEFVAVKTFAPLSNEENDELGVEDTWVGEQLELLRIEAYQVAKLRHPRIVGMYGIAESPSFGPCLVSEYLDGGSIYDHIVAKDSVFPDYKLSRRVARHVADAMRYLHSKSVIHRDLKSANVLVATDDRRTQPMRWRFKVADFGTSRILLDNLWAKANALHVAKKEQGSLREYVARHAASFFDMRQEFWWQRRRRRRRRRREAAAQRDILAEKPSPSAKEADLEMPPPPGVGGVGGVLAEGDEKLLTTQVGTPLFMAPELLVSHDYDTKIDVYSFAILVWECSARSTNWFADFGENAGPGCSNLFRQVSDGLRPRILSSFDPHLATLMKECWAKNPKERPDFREIHETLERLRRDSSSHDYDTPQKDHQAGKQLDAQVIGEKREEESDSGALTRV